MKKQLGPSDILFPVPAALIAGGSLEKPSVLTVAWIGMMGSDPPVLAISLKKSRHSLDIIRKSKEFTVNIPSAKHFREVDFCGLVSGRTQHKLKEIGFTAAPGSVVKAPLIEECPFNPWSAGSYAKQGLETGPSSSEKSWRRMLTKIRSILTPAGSLSPESIPLSTARPFANTGIWENGLALAFMPERN